MKTRFKVIGLVALFLTMMMVWPTSCSILPTHGSMAAMFWRICGVG